MSAAVKRGIFIVFEGVDRAGKSTQCRKLAEALRDRHIKTELIHFPDRDTQIGQLINNYLKGGDTTNAIAPLNDHVIHLLFTANRWEHSQRIQRLLNEGVTLICDRYSYSGIAYSAIKKNIDFEWCKGPENGLPKPDMVFFLELSVEEARQRGDFGKERYETAAIQQRVKEAFKRLSDECWITVDASKDAATLHGAILKSVIARIETLADDAPIETLNF